MLKKIAVLVLCALPMFAMAQDNRLAHVNSQEVIMAMPEIAEIQRTMDALQTEWEEVLWGMQEEYFSKIREFQERLDTMPASIREVRQSEIIDLEQRINTFRQTAQQDLQQRQAEMFSPVVQRVRQAIEAVGAENDFIYIFDLATESIVFMSPSANDATPLVKARLGIR
jgi:outer membrane protein